MFLPTPIKVYGYSSTKSTIFCPGLSSSFKLPTLFPCELRLEAASWTFTLRTSPSLDVLVSMTLASGQSPRLACSSTTGTTATFRLEPQLTQRFQTPWASWSLEPQLTQRFQRLGHLGSWTSAYSTFSNALGILVTLNLSLLNALNVLGILALEPQLTQRFQMPWASWLLSRTKLGFSLTHTLSMYTLSRSTLHKNGLTLIGKRCYSHLLLLQYRTRWQFFTSYWRRLQVQFTTSCRRA